jgi:hypothetical protein
MSNGEAKGMLHLPVHEGEAHGQQGFGGANDGDFDDDEGEFHEQHPQGEVELMQWADTLVQDPAFFEVVRSRTSASIFPQVRCA